MVAIYDIHGRLVTAKAIMLSAKDFNDMNDADTSVEKIIGEHCNYAMIRLGFSSERAAEAIVAEVAKY